MLIYEYEIRETTFKITFDQNSIMKSQVNNDFKSHIPLIGGLAMSRFGPAFSGLAYWTEPRDLLSCWWPIHYPTTFIVFIFILLYDLNPTYKHKLTPLPRSFSKT
jgi:hypothetical protein